MEKIIGNEAAFSTSSTFNSDGQTCDSGYTGLTIRQYFSALNMAALNANPDSWNRSENDKAEWAVKDADALIKELNKP